MKTYTTEERIRKAAKKAQTRVELMKIVSSFTDEIIAEDERLWSVNKRWRTYGTWRTEVFANEYHFGCELANKLQAIHIITHDEDKVFSLEDLREEIEAAVYEIANEEF